MKNSVVLVADDPDLEDTVARYALILDVEPVAAGPLRILPLLHGQVEIVALTDFDTVLPGEQVPALPYMAAQTVTVRDVHAAWKLVEDNGFTPREHPGGFFVGAAQARGAALVYRQAVR